MPARLAALFLACALAAGCAAVPTGGGVGAGGASVGVITGNVVQLVPTNRQIVRGGDFVPELMVWHRGETRHYNSGLGEIPARVVRDEFSAIAWVREEMGLDPRQVVIYCPGGIPGYVCRDHDEFDDFIDLL
ncbi:MAG: hypothetical protein WCZ72_05320 [Gemmobacter sp.]